MQKIRYTPEEEQLLMSKLWNPLIADDLESYVLFVFPWRQVGTPLERTKGPRKWQRKLLRQISDHIKKNKDLDLQGLMMEILRLLRVSGRGIGKSAVISMIVHWFLTTRIGSTVLISANTESQLQKVTWSELTKWFSMSINSHWWEDSATTMKPAKWLTELVERDLKKGTRYWGAEGKLWSEEKPDSYAGPHNMDGMMVIFDEASGIPDAIWTVALGFFTENTPNRFFFGFSNGRRNEGYFYEAIEGSKSEFWQSESIDARDVEDTDKSVYQLIIDEFGADSDEARVEVYGQFPKRNNDQFISSVVVSQAMKRPKYNDPSAPVVMGVDPARGGDKTVIVVRKGRDLIHIKEYDDDDLMVVVGHVIEAIEEFKPCMTVIDEGGLGAGVVDRINEQKRYKVKGINSAWSSSDPLRYGNKRIQMWEKMKQWLDTASLPDNKKLKVALTSPKKIINSKGIKYLESKEDMKARGVRSPDEADALSFTFAFPVVSSQEIILKKKSRPVVYSTGSSGGWMSH